MSDFFEEWLAGLEKLAFAEIVKGAGGVELEGRDGCPMPGACHPYYADKAALIQAWLLGDPGYSDPWHLVLAVAPSLRATYLIEEDAPTVADVSKKIVLTKRECAGPAPYVGDPYCYRWFAAVDDLGRCVAGEAHRVWMRP